MSLSTMTFQSSRQETNLSKNIAEHCSKQKNVTTITHNENFQNIYSTPTRWIRGDYHGSTHLVGLIYIISHSTHARGIDVKYSAIQHKIWDTICQISSTHSLTYACTPPD